MTNRKRRLQESILVVLYFLFRHIETVSETKQVPEMVLSSECSDSELKHSSETIIGTLLGQQIRNHSVPELRRFLGLRRQAEWKHLELRHSLVAQFDPESGQYPEMRLS